MSTNEEMLVSAFQEKIVANHRKWSQMVAIDRKCRKGSQMVADDRI